MDKTELFDAIWELVKDTNPPVDFKEVFVGDEKTNQVYFLFDNLNKYVIDKKSTRKANA